MFYTLEKTNPFTVEEENLICIFDTSSRDVLIKEISGYIPLFDESDDPELVETVVNTINKLRAMTDDEFLELLFYPASYVYDAQDSDMEV